MSFKFQFSLEVLNHLGRGLYRSFASVVAEAVSNSWDAEATRVDITIDTKKKEMIIRDNGKGMDENDLQNKFLKIGYSRRSEENINLKRKILGRKGIGKLALLSISEKVTIRTKKSNASSEVGGVIDNRELDEQIEEQGGYSLGDLDSNNEYYENKTGTYLKFELIKDTVNRPEIIKKYLAVMFNFTFSFENEKFDMYVNNEKISNQDFEELNENTEYLWWIDIDDNKKNNLLQRFKNIVMERDLGTNDFCDNNKKEYKLSGFVASVIKRKHIHVRGTNKEVKAGLHLFVNGRLRQENIFLDIPSRRIGEDYLYGEIHIDDLDDEKDGEDFFTSSREGLIKDSHIYQFYIEALTKIHHEVINDWNKWRREKSKKLTEKITDSKYLKPERQKVLDKLMSSTEDDLNRNLLEFLEVVIPKQREEKILICHTFDDKDNATIVYSELIENYGFSPSDFIFTNSPHKESRIPAGVDIFEYLADKFLQNRDWYGSSGLYVIFIISDAMKASWYPSLEAGAAWVARSDHDCVLVNCSETTPKTPPTPLDTNKLFISFGKNSDDFEDELTAASIFELLQKRFNKG